MDRFTAHTGSPRLEIKDSKSKCSPLQVDFEVFHNRKCRRKAPIWEPHHRETTPRVARMVIARRKNGKKRID